jgi:hypothetical protein
MLAVAAMCGVPRAKTESPLRVTVIRGWRSKRKNTMVSRDYTKEMGLNLAQKTVPMPYVLGLLTLIVALGGYGFHATWPVSHAKPADKKMAATPPAVAPVAPSGQ